MNLGVTSAPPYPTIIGTSAGAPTTGSARKGQTYLDSNNVLYVCSVAGSPGTWVCPPGQILAATQYAPGTAASPSVTGSTPTAFDSTNASVTFVAPPSGKVKISAEGCGGMTVTGANGSVGWVNHTGGALVGVLRVVFRSTTGAAMPECVQVLTGLTAGTTYQLDFAGCNNTGADGVQLSIQGATSPVNGFSGPLLMTVLSA